MLSNVQTVRLSSCMNRWWKKLKNWPQKCERRAYAPEVAMFPFSVISLQHGREQSQARVNEELSERGGRGERRAFVSSSSRQLSISNTLQLLLETIVKRVLGAPNSSS